MTARKVYPQQMNPFGDDEEEAEEDDKNPFKSDDDDDDTAQPIVTPVLNGRLKSGDVSPVAAVKENGSNYNLEVPSHPGSNSGDGNRERSMLSAAEPTRDLTTKPKPSPRLRRSVLESPSPAVGDRPNSVAEIQSSTSPLPSGLTTPVKRRAPSVPTTDSSSSQPLPSPEKSPLPGAKKKPAPPPPTGLRRPEGPDERRKSSTDVDVRTLETKLNNLTISSGHSFTSLPVRRNSDASSVAAGLTPDRQSLNQNLTSSTEYLGEQQYHDLMGALKAEHDAIENELRELMAIPSKLRSAAQIAREERLMKDLLDNVKRRDELEDEEEQHDLQRTLGDAGNPAGPPKKMKKKRKFKIKSLLGGKS